MRGGWSYTPKKTIEAENLVRMIAISRRNALKLSILGGDFRLKVSCYGASPLADWDNLGKLVSDALNGVLWEDDRQVTEATVVKLPSAKGQERTEVVVESLTTDPR